MNKIYEIRLVRELPNDMILPSGETVAEVLEADDHCSRSCLVRCVEGLPVEVMGLDGGEPEDANLHRDFRWVADVMNHAYACGYRAGHDATDLCPRSEYPAVPGKYDAHGPGFSE